MKKKWAGVWIANVTPFKNDKIDTTALKTLIKKQLEAGIQGFCPAGTTGEGSTLTDSEFATVVETVLEVVAGRAAVVPGTGNNNTAHTIDRTKLAQKLGVDGALVVTPYYVKPTPAGLIRHFGEISKKVDLPLMLYNVPGRTGVNMMPETVVEVSKEANVAAIKDCSPLTQISYLLKMVGEKISVFSGEDPLFLPFLALGGKGIVSVAGNVVPVEMVQIYNQYQTGKMSDAQKDFLKLVPFIDALFCESNPIPVKAAVQMLGWASGEIRSPLAPISKKGEEIVRKELKGLGLL